MHAFTVLSSPLMEKHSGYLKAALKMPKSPEKQEERKSCYPSNKNSLFLPSLGLQQPPFYYMIYVLHYCDDLTEVQLHNICSSLS